MVLGRFLKNHLSAAAGETALAAGVLAQPYHLFNYYRWYSHRQKSRTYLLFHAWKSSISSRLVFAKIYYHPFLLAAVLVHFGHVATYHFHNRMVPKRCFLTYQTYDRIDSSHITSNQSALHSYKSDPSLFPFENLFLPSKGPKIEPWFQSKIKD